MCVSVLSHVLFISSSHIFERFITDSDTLSVIINCLQVCMCVGEKWTVIRVGQGYLAELKQIAQP